MTLTSKIERERSFSKTIGKRFINYLKYMYIEKVTSELGSAIDNKSTITTTPHDTSTRSWSRGEKTHSSDDILNIKTYSNIKQIFASKKVETEKKKNIKSS